MTKVKRLACWAFCKKSVEPYFYPNISKRSLLFRTVLPNNTNYHNFSSNSDRPLSALIDAFKTAAGGLKIKRCQCHFSRMPFENAKYTSLWPLRTFCCLELFQYPLFLGLCCYIRSFLNARAKGASPLNILSVGSSEKPAFLLCFVSAFYVLKLYFVSFLSAFKPR